MSVERRPILVLGLTDAGAAGLPDQLRARVRQAALLVGGARQLAAFPEFGGETLLISATVEPAIARLTLAWERGEVAVALASGDPLWYGIGASLRRALPPEALEVVPAPTAAQLAFAALAEPWHDAALLSAHGRPLDVAVAAAVRAPKAAILTDSRNTPAVIAAALIAAGSPPTSRCAICEHLGGQVQRVVRTTLADAANHAFAALNVFVIWNDSQSASPTGPASQSGKVADGQQAELSASGYRLAATPLSAMPAGLPDDAFSTEAGQITKREVRLLSLAELALDVGEILWDIGAGSGSVGIEAARARPDARVFAVERRAVFVEHARENLRRFPVPNLELVQGEAPEACVGWPDPHAVFVGGSGGRLADVIELARRRLRPGGRLVLNLVALEHLHIARVLLPDARVSQIQVSRGVPIEQALRLEALNPVFNLVWRKEIES